VLFVRDGWRLVADDRGGHSVGHDLVVRRVIEDIDGNVEFTAPATSITAAVVVGVILNLALYFEEQVRVDRRLRAYRRY
jgi:hypothetical protein